MASGVLCASSATHTHIRRAVQGGETGVRGRKCAMAVRLCARTSKTAVVHCGVPCTSTQTAAQNHFSPSAVASLIVAAIGTGSLPIDSTPPNRSCAISVLAALLSEHSYPCPTQHGSSHATTHGTSIRPSCVQPGWPSPSVVHSFTVAVITTRHSSEVSPERRVSVRACCLKSLGKLELTQTFSPQPERCRSRNKSLRVQGESRSCAVKREERVLTTPTTLDLTPRIRAASPPSRHPASLSTLSTPFTLRPAVSLLCAAPSPAHRSLEGTELSRRTSRTDRRVHGVQHRHDPRVRLSIHCHHPTSST